MVHIGIIFHISDLNYALICCNRRKSLPRPRLSFPKRKLRDRHLVTLLSTKCTLTEVCTRPVKTCRSFVAKFHASALLILSVWIYNTLEGSGSSSSNTSNKEEIMGGLLRSFLIYLNRIEKVNTQDGGDMRAFVVVVALARSGLLSCHIVDTVCVCCLFLSHYFSCITECLVWSALSLAPIISISVSLFRSPLDSHGNLSPSLRSCLSIILYYWPCIARLSRFFL